MSAILDYIFEFLVLMVLGKLLNSAFHRFFGGSTVRFGMPGSGARPGQAAAGDARKTVEGTTARDPECGMFVSTELSHRLNWHGNVLHFCSDECLQNYRRHAG
jgi:YHS domain-containing protein